MAEWQTVTPLETEDAPAQRRKPDLTALIPGVFFVVLAITLMTGVDLPLELWEDGALLWLLLIGGGIALLVSELRKAHRRKS